MLNIVEQAKVILIINDCQTINEVVECTNFIYGYILELVQNKEELKQMQFFLQKTSFSKIKEFLIEEL